ncbi:MAG: S1 RNA-binding domain-containing protein [Clostridia bacterium]|nr:S1 RNA-binding domain-containing protein [Clostridia bacterium]
MNKYMPEGYIVSTHKNREYISSIEGLEAALDKGVILEAGVTLCDHNFNLHVDLGPRVRAVIPRDEVLYVKEGEEIKDIAVLTRVGKTVCFKVIGFDRHDACKTTVILSRRAAQMECINNYISTLIPGDIIPTKITHLESFGAFVDIGCGITSLLSIDSISVSRISHPSVRLAVGDMIHTVVKSIDSKGRIYVSERELLGSWSENASLFNEGQTVKGVIRSVENYGVFIELRPNLAGLAEYRDDVRPGQAAAVYIKSIIPEKMKIKLIIIDSHDEEEYPEELEYFIDTDNVRHIDSWQYSPPNCKKVIETVFV